MKAKNKKWRRKNTLKMYGVTRVERTGRRIFANGWLKTNGRRKHIGGGVGDVIKIYDV